MSDSLRPHGLQPTRLLCPWNNPGQNTGVGCHSLLQGIFPTQGSNPGLPHCRQTLYSLNHQGSLAAAAKLLQSCPTLCDPRDSSPPGSPVPGILQARILEWVAMPSSRGSSQPRDRIQVSRIAGRFCLSHQGSPNYGDKEQTSKQ